LRHLPAALIVLKLLQAVAYGDAAAPATTIVMEDFMFAPVTLTVSAGSTVTWTNQPEEPHIVASESGLCRSAALDGNQSFPSTSINPALTATRVPSAHGWNHRGAVTA